MKMSFRSLVKRQPEKARRSALRARPCLESLEDRTLPSVGGLDLGFNATGKQTIDFGNDDQANAVAIQSDGKIVMAGSWDGGLADFAVVRLNPDGSLDHTFGNSTLKGGGLANYTFGTGTFGGVEKARAVAIQSDGKIVVAGYTDANGSASNPNNFAVLRLNPDGSLDTTFNGTGKQTIDFNADDQANAVAIQPDGKIVLAGSWDGGAADFALVRLNANGSLDTSFGNTTLKGGGLANYTFGTGLFGGVEKARAVAIQPNGKIVVTGYTDAGGSTSNPNNFAVLRVNSDGSLDTTFNGTGKQTIDFGNDDQANSVAIQPDGKIVLAGSWDGGHADFALVRLNANGSLDTSFGNTTLKGGGLANYTFGTFLATVEKASAVALQADGKIVVAGYTDAGGSRSNPNNFAVLRVNPDGSLDTTFNRSGEQTFGLGGNDQANALAIQPDGKIVLAGFTGAGGTTSNPNNFAVVRLIGTEVEESFVIGFDNQVYAQKFDANGNSAGAYFLTQPGQVKALSATRDASNNTELFIIGLDNQVYAQKFDLFGNSVGGYFFTQPGQVLSISAGRDGAGNPELFVIGLDNQVYAQKFDASGHPISGYALTQSGQVKAITVSADASNNPELFVIGLDNQVYAQKFNVLGNSVSSYFFTQPGQVLSISAGRDGTGKPELFIIGLDHQVYAQKFDATGNSVGGYVFTEPGQVKAINVARSVNNNPELFVIGLDDQVYAQLFDAAGNSAGAFFLTQPGRVKTVSGTP
jgi:uncharacterized delta-60 repeat protein